MGSCVAYGCTNRYSKKIPGIAFYKFPKNEEQKLLWIKAICRENWSPTPSSRLCSTHFPEHMIDRTSLNCIRLRENAVSTIFSAFPSYMQKENKPRKLPAVRSSQNVSKSTDMTSSDIASSDIIAYDIIPSDIIASGVTIETSENRQTSTSSELDTADMPNVIDRESLKPSPDKEHYKRQIENLYGQIESKNKKIKVLQQKVR